ncbi:MAG: hypothetical protein DRG78_01355 [Epsilonproteobacteria bacterium]|nr:MAG: hypothetical protein DRG78_01355 [Campylobacterota bacterium]
MHNIKYTALAKEDLFNIFEIISQDKPTVAVEYINKLEIYIELLESNPKMGVECENKNIKEDCRILIYENYLIFYRIIESDIHILRLINSKMNYQDRI